MYPGYPDWEYNPLLKGPIPLPVIEPGVLPYAAVQAEPLLFRREAPGKDGKIAYQENIVQKLPNPPKRKDRI